MKVKKAISVFVVSTILLLPFNVMAVEKVNPGETKEFTEEAYIFTPEEAKKSAENIERLKKLEKQLEEQKALVDNIKKSEELKDRQIELTEQEAEAYRKMYSDASTAYQRELDKNNKWYNKKWVYVVGGVALTIGSFFIAKQAFDD